MDLALSLTTPGLTVPELASLARWAEELGYGEAWLSEVAGPEAFVTAAATAAATERMTVGVAVVPAYTRTPAVLAMAASSVSQVLAGRPFRLGIGSSSEAIVDGWNGVAFERPLTRVRETAEAVRAGLDEVGDFEGRTVAMRRFRNAAPAAGPVSVYVGALNPGMLRVAGAVGDGVCLNMMPAEVVPRQLAEVRHGAAAAGRDPAGFGVMARLQVAVTDDPAPVREVLRRTFLGPYLAQPVYNRFLAWMGFEDEAAAIAEGWAARDREAVARAVHDGLVDRLTLVGDGGAVRDRLDAFAGAGVTTAALSVLSPDRAVVEETLRVLAPA
ncbi:MAG: LLM class F420-dependent oxidoreductase [Acidimicrobiia bacterium]|jgi:probable F420-dependent oxidoreductase